MFILTLALTVLAGSGEKPDSRGASLWGSEITFRLGAGGTVSDDDVARAKATAGKLLASIGVASSWIDCTASNPCTPGAARQSIRVQLMPVDSRVDRGRCGVVTRDPATTAPTILVYVPAVSRLALAVTRGQASRLYPVLNGLRVGDVLGMTIAHEAGHAVGMGHVSRGVMKASPGPSELAALLTGRLRFE